MSAVEEIETLREQLAKEAQETPSPSIGVKALIGVRLAEAYAWIVEPAQPHGSNGSAA